VLREAVLRARDPLAPLDFERDEADRFAVDAEPPEELVRRLELDPDVVRREPPEPEVERRELPELERLLLPDEPDPELLPLGCGMFPPLWTVAAISHVVC
jgi:hypothetical protein